MFYVYAISVIVVAFCLAMTIYSRGLNILHRFFFKQKIENYVFLPLVIIGAPVFFAISLFFGKAQDILFSVSTLDISYIFLSCLIIGLSGFLRKKYFLPILLSLFIVGYMFVLPKDFLLFEGLVPFWHDRAATFAIWLIFASGFCFFAETDGLLPEICSLLGLDLIIFSAFGLSSVQLAMFASVLLGVSFAFLIFNGHPAELKINSASSCVFGFFTGWLLIAFCGEGMGLSALILSTLIFIEIAIFIISRYVFLQKAPVPFDEIKDTDERLPDNSDFKCRQFARLQLFLTILALVQAYALKSAALPLFSVLFMLWLTGRLGFEGRQKTFREINHQFISDIKSNIHQFFHKADKDD